MAFVILGLIGAVIVAGASIAGLLISAEAELNDGAQGRTEQQPRLG